MSWRHQMALTIAARLNEVSLRPRGSGAMVKRFEEAFAAYVGAKHCIAMANGTLTLEVALRALDRKYHVGVTPLTMSATTAAILNAGCVPWFADVDPDTWILPDNYIGPEAVSVSLFGLEAGFGWLVDDAAQRLGKHHPGNHFSSHSFQSSKIMSSGEGGALTTDDDDLAQRARSIASLGYDLSRSSRIDRNAIRDPDAIRHIRLGTNGRMNDLTAAVLLAQLDYADQLVEERRLCASLYREAHQGCDWLTPQRIPEGATHDYWCYPLLLDKTVSEITHDGGRYWGYPMTFNRFAAVMQSHGSERPYACWRLTYRESAFAHLAPAGGCPVAESIQPRLLLMQTNDLDAAHQNAEALRKAIREIGG